MRIRRQDSLHTGRATLDFDTVEYGVGGVRLFRPDEVIEGQKGFATDGDDWRTAWFVIGHELACGDPIFVAAESPHRVFTAMHGEGSWEPEAVAPSLEVFRECLRVFQRFATGRGNELEHQANPPTADEEAAFLDEIRGLTNNDQETLGFWAVQVEVDLESFEG